MPLNTSSIIFSTLGLATGVWAMLKTQEVTKPLFEAVIMPACMSASKNYETMEDFVSQTGMVAYEPRLGVVVMEVFVCMITQFLEMLTRPENDPVGLIAWLTTMLLAIPATIVMILEAGRQGNRGLILWPTLMGMLAQLLGISVVFPALVVPAYCLGRPPKIKLLTNKGPIEQQQGSVAVTRARMSLLMALPGVVLSALVFLILDKQSYAWTFCVGLLGGPLLPCMCLILWVVPPPNAIMPRVDIVESGKTAAMSFGFGGMLAVLGWIYLIFVAVKAYVFDYQGLWQDLWAGPDASPAVRFMTIDAGILYVGLILHIGSRSLSSMVEALLLTPFFGPAAACCMALAANEKENIPLTYKQPTSTTTTTPDKKEQ